MARPTSDPAALPELRLASWQPTKDTLHLYLQILGKVRMALMPPLNHWWHVTLYVTARGLTTGAIPLGSGSFQIRVDLIDHRIEVATAAGAVRGLELRDGLSVAEFHAAFFRILSELGVAVKILAIPYDTISEIPFAEDREHAAYDAAAVERFWRSLVAVAGMLEEFRSRFVGKSTPVHLFWHGFDLALTRFSGRPAPPMPGANRVTREAYSHEVISFGFWAGDENFPEAAFYSYTFPEPEDLAGRPLAPAPAFWRSLGESSQAILRWDDVRSAKDPRGLVLEFLESAYQAGARAAGWDVDALVHRFQG